MKIKKWLLSSLYLIITIAAFALSAFKFDNPVWIAAWIAPIFLIRFMRANKWIPAVVFGFLVMQVAFFAAMIPTMEMMDTSSVNMSPGFILNMQAESGTLFIALLYLVPFLADKALYKYLPKFAASLVYPSAVVAVDLYYALTTGLIGSFGESQITLRPLIMTTSLFGIFGLTFLVAWFASTINVLWEENWEIKKFGYSGLIYPIVAVSLLAYGSIAVAFPQKPTTTVMVAGITLENGFFDRMGETDLYVDELFDSDPASFAEVMRSPQSHMDEVLQKTMDAINAGAEIIIWQEYALILESSVADDLLLDMQALADESDVYLLVSYGRILSSVERKDQPLVNGSVLITPDGEIAWEYAKVFTAPGYENHMAEAGQPDIPYIDTPYGRIGQIICADMHHPFYIRQAGTRKIDLLLNPAFDTEPMTPLLAFAPGVRAVENGFTTIRVTGYGQSVVFDPYYRQWGSQNSFEQGNPNFYVNIPVISGETFYTRIGYVFPYVIVVLLISLAGGAIARRITRKQS